MIPLSQADVAAAETIKGLIDQRGTDWLFDPRRCESILNDLLANHHEDEYGGGREGRLVINILAAAAKCGVPADLAKYRDGKANLSLESMRRKWMTCLCKTEGKSEPLAERAIVLWAAALAVELPPGRKPEDDKPDDEKDPRPPRGRWPWIAAVVAVTLLLGAVAISTTPGAKQLRDRVVAWVWPPTPPPVAPRVILVSVPTDRPHEAGGRIEVRAEFDRPVKVTGRPILPFRAGGQDIDATYDRGDGTAELVFAFEVPRRDEEVVGIEFRRPARIATAGGTITDRASGAAARLEVPLSPDLARVTLLADKKPPQPAPPRAPRATALRVASDRIYAAGDAVELSLTFSRPVTVTGSPRIRFTVGADPTPRFARFQTGNESALLTFVLDVPDGVESEGIDMGASPSIDLAGGTIIDAETLTAASLDLRGLEPGNLATVRINSTPPPLKDRIEVATGPGRRMQLLLVPAGRREIPAETLREYQTYADMGMPTTLQIDRPFYIGETEVTLAEFVDVVGRPPADAVLPPPDAPQLTLSATAVRWDEAIQFCNALSKRDGMKPCYRIDPAPEGEGVPRVTRLADGDGFRLPLPDEWVYACLTTEKGKLQNMTTGVMEWSELRPGDERPLAHGGYDAEGGFTRGPTFLRRRKLSDTSQYIGFRITRAVEQPASTP